MCGLSSLRWWCVDDTGGGTCGVSLSLLQLALSTLAARCDCVAVDIEVKWDAIKCFIASEFVNGGVKSEKCQVDGYATNKDTAKEDTKDGNSNNSHERQGNLDGKWII